MLTKAKMIRLLLTIGRSHSVRMIQRKLKSTLNNKVCTSPGRKIGRVTPDTWRPGFTLTLLNMRPCLIKTFCTPRQETQISGSILGLALQTLRRKTDTFNWLLVTILRYRPSRCDNGSTWTTSMDSLSDFRKVISCYFATIDLRTEDLVFNYMKERKESSV